MNSIQSAKEPSASSLMSITSSSKCSIKIPVKIGSNQIYVSISKETKCAQLVRMALNQCKIKSNYKSILVGESARHLISRDSYVLFERAAGIEQMIKNEQNVFELWLQWKLRHAERQVEFIIKKFRNSKKLATAMTRTKKVNSHKLFELGRQKAGIVKSGVVKSCENKLSMAYEIQTHLYERIDSEFDCPRHFSDNNIQQASQPIANTDKTVSAILRHVKNVKRMINHLNGTKKC